MTIVEFLLARIAEDEESTFELVPYSCPPGCCSPAGWAGHHCRICNTTEYGGSREAITELAEQHDEGIHQRSRRLAECAAKRAIVEELAPYCWEGMPPCGVCSRLGCRALRLLTAVYADHPDYNQAWSIQ